MMASFWSHFYPPVIWLYNLLFSHFIQSDLQTRTTEAINWSIKKLKTDRTLKLYAYYILGMHDVYRTDRLSTNMGEKDVIFIAQ